jgi:hypothetical protein
LYINQQQKTLIEQTKSIFKQKFNMKDDGELHYTLGNAILHNRKEGWTILHQKRYLISKLQKFCMLNSNPLSNPCKWAQD